MKHTLITIPKPKDKKRNFWSSIEKPSYNPNSQFQVQKLGDIGFFFHILNSVAFLAMVVADVNGFIDVIDPVVKKDGFCISF